ncbi:hypothetical protein AQULUS_01540 [Aquicella lusitana]|uniref:Uncharacterized protein n=1 Tax=Aquicella lusitana TaxID=254246 RepID=A0A370G8S1_9COXI|nr:hypothetical protein C8D86_1231 [Aquicella lusitana]VVC72442.1 hypothetical protein AQULUS_01540 [Aquicella lusitana]
MIQVHRTVVRCAQDDSLSEIVNNPINRGKYAQLKFYSERNASMGSSREARYAG